MAQNGDVAITVDGPGTGDGFELFCAGDVDVADASRPIKAEEVRACEAAGIDFIELPVGVDGLSVVTSASNPIACLNMLDLYALTGPESEGIETWDEAEVLARELGSDTDLPSSHLIVTAPGPGKNDSRHWAKASRFQAVIPPSMTRTWPTFRS